MRTRSIVLPAAAALALAGSPIAHAQTTAVPGSTVTTPGTGVGSGFFRFVPGTGFVPNTTFGQAGVFPQTPGGLFTFVPGTGFVPRTGINTAGVPFTTGAFPPATPGPLQFVPGVGFAPTNTTAFNPGAGPLQFVPGVGFAPTTVTGINPGAAGPLQFVPGIGFVPQAQAAQVGSQTGLRFVPGVGFIQDNNVLAETGFSTLTPTTGFGFGGTFAPGFGGAVVAGPGGVTVIPGTGAVTFPGTGVVQTNPGVPPMPIVNGVRTSAAVPVQNVTAAPAVVQRVAGSRQETVASDPEETRLALRMENIMERQPMTEGEVTNLGATQVRVRFTTGGETRSESFPVERVFFYHPDTSGEWRLASVASAPNEVAEGDMVMVPLPAREEPRTAVAGSREESVEAPAPAEQPAPVVETRPAPVRSNVAGSRQSGRRPAK